MSALCRDCLTDWAEPPAGPTAGPHAAAPAAPPGGSRCPACGGRRLLAHPELARLSIAHIDCDAFYASVEKRDDPSLKDQPVIVGGGKRGVVSAACYVARLYGVHSAMPMFKALKACPDAVVVRPNMKKYQTIGREIRAMMRDLTPLVEPLSIDEAFLDLTGTEKLHGASPAQSLAKLVTRIESELALTASIGLSYNKFLAKVASDLDKPRGFAVIGQAEAEEFLADKPVGIIWGVGKALQSSLARDGIRKVRDLKPHEESWLVARYGSIGRRLYRFARGRDSRRVVADAPTKSISAETTFNRDIADPGELAARLWPLCETVSYRLKKAELAGGTVTLKLKTASFRLITRSQKLLEPTQMAEEIYRCARPLLEKAAEESGGQPFRLIGVGCAELQPGAAADRPELLDPDKTKRLKVESAIDAVREKLGPEAITKGRGLPAQQRKAARKEEARNEAAHPGPEKKQAERLQDAGSRQRKTQALAQSLAFSRETCVRVLTVLGHHTKHKPGPKKLTNRRPFKMKTRSDGKTPATQQRAPALPAGN